MLTKHQDSIPQDIFEYLTKTGTPPQEGRGEKGGNQEKRVPHFSSD